MGLIARALEKVGIATVSLTSAWTITASANPPRAAFTDFPLGNTAGPPNEPAVQKEIVRKTLELVESVSEPGTIVPVGDGWPVEWKDEARELRDHRTVRESSPQYERDSDRESAIVEHGEAAACGSC